MHPDDLEALVSKRICCECVREEFLSQLIENDGNTAACDYCGQDGAKTWAIGDLADKVETAFNDHMVRTATGPDETERALYADRELNLTWYRDGQETAYAIEDIASIPSKAAQDVQDVLADRYDDFDSAMMGEETHFSADACYVESKIDAAEWHWEWTSFEASLKTEARFFNRSGAETLARVFSNIDLLRTKPRHPLIVKAGPNRRINHVYRSRVFQSNSELEEAICRPDLHIGSPPARLSKAGRMNATGISVFYGATNGAVALAEVRPPVGSKVAVAKFNIIRSLRLLDLTALDHVRDAGSLFDPTLKARLERVAFLKSLGERMTRPVMPGDEDFDYLTTQAVADFLATENQPRLDGIIFPSAQSKSGRNVVLFHAAALVDKMDLPKGTQIHGRTEEFYEDESAPSYWVWEDVPAAQSNQDGSRMRPVFNDVWNYGSPRDESREPALKVDPASLEVHHIEWVQVRSTTFTVHRTRSVRQSS
jgi:RES domain-containing protein